MNTNIVEEKYLEWFKDYFKQADIEESTDGKYYKEWIDYLTEKRKKNELLSYFGSAFYGRLGAAVRNYMRENHPEIDKDFKDNYGAFEDYSYELLNKMIDSENKK